jgi:PhnB protein
MAAHISPYLHLAGKCHEAMNFYKECFGGELTLQTVGESPMAHQFPAGLQKQVLHASLINASLVLLGSDMSESTEKVSGNNISLSLNCSTAEEMTTFFSNLSNGGKINHPIHEFFAGLMANLVDKFGITWMLYCEKK